MKTLDLHGFKHSEVAKAIDDFIYKNDFVEFKIIYGNSNRMLEIVIKCLKNYSLKIERRDSSLNRKYLVVRIK
jgi:hypothetical protein